MRYETVHTQAGAVQMPKVRIKEAKPTYSYEALRGYGYILLVCEDGQPIGWADCGLLGFDSVAQFLTSKV